MVGSSKVNVVIDIETLVHPVTVSDISQFMASWKPSGAVKKEKTIARHREEAQAEAASLIADKRRFTLGGKRMISCAVGLAVGNDVKEIECWASEDLSIITQGIVDYLDEFSEYRLIGWNLKKFDLPEIVKSFALTHKRPKRAVGKWDVIDLADYPFKETKLKDAAKAFGLEILETHGGDVQRLYEQGMWDEIKHYNKYDVYLTGKIFGFTEALYNLG